MILNNEKRILILRGSSQYVTPGSYNIQEVGLAKALVSSGWKVLIISSGPKEKSVNYGENIEWLELKRVGTKFGWPKDTLNVVQKFKPDIIQCQDITNPSTYIALLIKYKFKIPLVLSIGEYKLNGGLTSIFTKVTALVSRRNTEAILCKTNSSLSFAKSLGFKNRIYAPVGIDESVYAEEARANENKAWMDKIVEARRKGDYLLCHIGRLDKGDNIKFLFDILRELPSGFKLVVVGEPKDYAESLIDNQIKNNVILTGAVPNELIGAVLKHSDLYLSCSEYEIFGMAAAESIYHNCPVIGYSTGGIKEIIIDKVTGLLVEEREVKTWATIIQKLVNSDEFKKMKVGCNQERENLKWSKRAMVYEQAYKKALQINNNDN